MSGWMRLMACMLAPALWTNPAAGQVVATGQLSAFVNWDYHHRKPLQGARSTALAIQATLNQWKGASAAPVMLENGTPEQMGSFLKNLPAGALVYLASHQSPVADWDFTQKKLVNLGELLPANVVPDKNRIVILDACFAESVGQLPGWKVFAPNCLMAGKAGEETFELELFTRRPVEFEARYPEEVAWLKQRLPEKWNGRITFLGLMWIRAFLQTPSAPKSMQDWRNFFGKIQTAAAEFRAKRASKLASTPVFYFSE
ncbi:MAG: hypothetical protein PHD76_03265 [Methylacidiphilales bacterium]|nr:hypothetical protein [Candidatus Methylacidiphilales bacterium]